jgi:hypothetical protein
LELASAATGAKNLKEGRMEKKFRVLRIVATIIKVLAWIILVLGVLGGCLTLGGGLLAGGTGSRGGGEFGPLAGLLTGAFGGIFVIIFSVLEFLFLYAFGELIHLLLALEENTRLTAERLQAMQKT